MFLTHSLTVRSHICGKLWQIKYINVPSMTAFCIVCGHNWHACLGVNMVVSNFYITINIILMLHPNVWKPCIRVCEINYWLSQLLWCRGTKTGMMLSPDSFQHNYDANSNLGTAKVSLTSSNGGERRAAGWAGGQPAGVSGSTDSRRAILAGSASWPSTWT